MSIHATPKLIIINGQPGSGKTTLKTRLHVDLQVPAIGKDDFKEFLFDALGQPKTAVWSTALGRVASVNLNSTAEVLLGQGDDVIIESAFIRSFAYPDLKQVVDNTGTMVLELYCRCDAASRRERFDARITTGKRHIVHTDTINQLSDKEIATRYAPLGLGKTLYVDTAEFDDKAYTQLLKQVRKFMKEGS